MRLRNLVVWNKDVNEPPEEKKEIKNKRGARNGGKERINYGQCRSVLLRAQKRTSDS